METSELPEAPFEGDPVEEEVEEVEELDIVNPSHSRFKGASWYGHFERIIIGGAGGIGSWLSLFLARQGHSLYIYDFDAVEKHNIGGQLYSNIHIGANKAQAISMFCRNAGGTGVISVYGRYEIDSLRGGVMFSCFDNMSSRLTMFNNWMSARNQYPDKVSIFIDGRLNAETAEFFCVTDDKSAAKWRDEWFDDSKVPDAPCTFKATSHCAALLAGMMVAAFNNHLSRYYVKEPRTIPYKTTIWLPTMMVLTEEL